MGETVIEEPYRLFDHSIVGLAGIEPAFPKN
jgi:hypothetical protein